MSSGKIVGRNDSRMKPSRHVFLKVFQDFFGVGPNVTMPPVVPIEHSRLSASGCHDSQPAIFLSRSGAINKTRVSPASEGRSLARQEPSRLVVGAKFGSAVVLARYSRKLLVMCKQEQMVRGWADWACKTQNNARRTCRRDH